MNPIVEQAQELGACDTEYLIYAVGAMRAMALLADHMFRLRDDGLNVREAFLQSYQIASATTLEAVAVLGGDRRCDRAARRIMEIATGDQP